MLYKALYLPVNKPLEDGCDVINRNGEHFIYDEATHLPYNTTSNLRRAELFLVSYEFNQLVVIGKPSPEAKWLKNGMDVKACDCEEWVYWTERNIWFGKNNPTPEPGEIITFLKYFRIKCPTCQQLH